MSEAQTATENVVEEQIQDNGNAISNALQNMVFGEDKPVEHTVAETNLHQEEVKPDAQAAQVEVVEPTWFKNRGWDSEEVADNEIKTLREKAEKTFEYKNEESKKIAEYINEGKEEDLYKYLDIKRRVEKLSTAELADKNIAAELVKFGIQKDNPTLNAEEVEFLFNEKYSIPEKPVQGDLEDETDYQTRLNVWQHQTNTIEKRLVIEAKMQQPKLSQLKTELVLPEIKRENQSQQKMPTQEELAAFAKERDNFLQSATKTINDFNGFNVQVKDKDVDYTVGYIPSQEERTFINGKIQKFAQSGFDANAIFKEDWVGADGKTLNVNKMTEDLSRIYFGKNADSKLAFDSANKRLEAYLKEKKQVDLSATVVKGTFNPNKNQNETVSDKLREAMFG